MLTFDTIGDADFWMAWCDRIQLTELQNDPAFSAIAIAFRKDANGGVSGPYLLQVVKGDLVAKKVEHDVLERTTVSIREHESVAVELYGGIWAKR